MCRKIITNCLRHSDTPHLLMNGIPNQLPVALARALVDSDYANLPGACARPDGESSAGALSPDESS